ncbi:MAG: hypothetical protein PHD41_06915 [Methanosarcinaceae archaeon]|nr:hypothetical protein [Methanosarcinaceae archaeon]
MTIPSVVSEERSFALLMLPIEIFMASQNFTRGPAPLINQNIPIIIEETGI